jgi:hypothetical protein
MASLTAGNALSLGDRLVSFVRNLMPQNSLGNVWQGEEASHAFRKGPLRSQRAGPSIRVAFRNTSPLPLLLCWVSEKGELHGFHKLPPASDFLFGNQVTVGDHVQNSYEGHAFCIARAPEEEEYETEKIKSLKEGSIIGGYRTGQLPESSQSDRMHLVTISQRVKREVICCRPGGGLRGLLKRKLKAHDDDDDDDNDILEDWLVDVREAEFDKSPFDTTDKIYEHSILGGWPVRVEKDWSGGDKELEKLLARDLECAAKLLPDHAREFLKANCAVWVNKTLHYGPAVCPIKGRGCCYHPDRNWLEENGMHPDKAKCIEINDGPKYASDHWGTGGVMVHELSHAYHHGMLEGGYDNKEIEECYTKAMKEGLYNCVRVKGSEGPEAKAYACNNCMEYWAELSTAFLGGLGNEEYNKWFPFNRKQLKEHDPRAYRLLARLWKVDCK